MLPQINSLLSPLSTAPYVYKYIYIGERIKETEKLKLDNEILFGVELHRTSFE